MISLGSTDCDVAVDDHVEVRQLCRVHQQIRREIVQSVSTRGNCKQSSCVVIPVNQIYDCIMNLSMLYEQSGLILQGAKTSEIRVNSDRYF